MRTSTVPALVFVSLFALSAPADVRAQAPAAEYSSSATTAMALPEAPSALLSPAAPDSAADGVAGFVPSAVAGKYRRTIKPDQQAQTLSAGDKLKLSVVNQFTLSNLAGNLISAGITHWDDGRPHYGVDSGAFGQRLGATSLKGFTQSVFSYGIFAAAFHDDPRYYVMGPSQPFKKRVIYSASRMIITKKDNGSSAVNWSRLAGITSAAALSNTYYPERDRSVGKTATSALTSIGTGAAINELNEFLGDVMKKIHHKK